MLAPWNPWIPNAIPGPKNCGQDSLVLAHQYLGQLEAEIRDAVFGNVGTFISFRVGALDAPTIARELAPTFEPEDLISLPNYHIYLRLMIDGEVSKPFSAKTLPPNFE